MKKHSLVHIYAVLLVFVGLLSFSQPALCNRIEEQLEKSDRLIEEDKPQSAAELLESILVNKKSEPVQLLEAVCKLSKVYSLYKEDYEAATLGCLRLLENNLQEQYLAVCYALLANFFADYLEQNIYDIGNNHSNGGPDFTKWNKETFQDTIWYYQLKSTLTAPKACQKSGVGQFEKIITKQTINITPLYSSSQNPEQIELVQNLQQMLICNAIAHPIDRYWTQSYYGLSAKMLYDKRAYGSADRFIGMCKEYDVCQWSAGTFYMLYKLTELAENMPVHYKAAVDLYRLNLLESRGVNDDYRSGLETLAEQYASLGEPLAVYFYYLCALYYNSIDECISADSICNVAVSLFPKDKRSDICKSLKQQISAPVIDVEFDRNLAKEHHNLGYISVSNIERVYYTLAPVDFDAFSDYMSRHELNTLDIKDNSGIDWNKAVKWEQAVNENVFLKKTGLFFDIPPLDSSNYILFIADSPQFGKQTTAVACRLTNEKYTGIMFQSQYPENLGFIVDLYDGEPAAGKSFSLFANQNNGEKGKLRYKDVTGQLGSVQVRNLKTGNYLLSFDDGSFSSRTYYYSPSKRNIAGYKCNVYTDRNVYRPKDTVNVYALVAYADDAGNVDLQKNKSVVLQFFDYRNKSSINVPLETDDFGACSNSFAVPSDAVPGYMYVRVLVDGNTVAEQGVQIIEFVQPEMTVSMSAGQKFCEFGKTVTISGTAKSFSGIPVSGAIVNYSIDSYVQDGSLYHGMRRLEPYRILEGHAVVANDGTFSIGFIPMLPDNPRNVTQIRYEINANVVADDGNSADCNMNVIVDSEPLSIRICNQSDCVSNGAIAVNAEIVNSNGISIDDYYHYSLVKLHDQAPKYAYSRSEKTILKDNLEQMKELFPYYAFQNEDDYNTWDFEKEICTGYARQGKTLPIANNLENGVYRLEVGYSYNGAVVKDSSNIVCVATNSGKPAGNSLFTAQVEDEWCVPGQTALVTLQSPYKDVVVYCFYSDNTGVLKTDTIHLSESVRTLPIEIKPDDIREQIVVGFIAVKEKRYLYRNITLNISQKDLNIVVDRFDEKLESGTANDINLHITDNNGKNVKARVLLSLNDASLYLFGLNTWRKPADVYELHDNVQPYVTSFGLEHYTPLWPGKPEQQKYRGLELSNRILDDFGFKRYAVKATRLAGSSMLVGLKEQEQSNEAFADSYSSAVFPDMEIAVRSIFTNTALFKAYNTTDNGTLHVRFTAPDLLTEWNLQILAYNSRLESGIKQKKSVTYRPLMIESLPLQFVTQGDTVLFAARVSNASNYPIEAQVFMSIKDTSGMELEGVVLDSKIKNVSVPANASASVRFKIAVPHEIENLDYTLLVSDGKNADGEHRILPVRSNIITLKESVAFFNNGLETRSFPVGFKLDGNTRINSLILEVTPDAVWDVLRSIPDLCVKEPVTNIDYFSNLYADLLYYAIFVEYPEIRRQADADNSKMSHIVSTAHASFSALKNRMNSDGGWSWISGADSMSDLYITVQILKGLGDLKRLGVLDRAEDLIDTKELYGIIDKAVSYVDSQMYKYYSKEIGYKSDRTSLGYQEIMYLYARSLCSDCDNMNGNIAKMFNYYLKVAAKQKRTSLTLRDRALLCMVLSKQGNKKDAEKYADGIVERSITQDESGMFWRDNTGCSVIECQSLVIQALAMNGFDNEAELATRWLIKQKQSTAWINAQQTIYSIAALLDNGMLGIPQEESDIVVSFDGGNINQIEIDGTADYVKELDYTQLGNIRTLSIENKTDKMCWGALYCGYQKFIDHIEPYSTGLSIERKYYVLKGGDKNNMTEVTDISRINTGDRVVVSLTVSSDRTVDYVAITDLRAAGFIVSDQKAGWKYSNGIRFYIAPGIENCRMYVHRIERGEQTFEYELTKVADGQFAVGPATIESTIAPEFRAATGGTIE